MEITYTNDFIYFIPYLSAELQKFDVNSHELSTEIFLDSINLGYAPHLTPLPTNKLFIQGGIFHLELAPTCFIYDILEKSFEEKSPGLASSAAACILYANKIFLFGGASTDGLKPSEINQKFDLDLNSWEQIAPLPFPSYNNTCGMRENKVAIVGLHLKNLFYYSPKENRFFEDLQIDGVYKVLLVFEENLYVVVGRSVKALEGGEWKEYESNCEKKFSIVYSYTVCRNGFIYFAAPAHEIARLNLETKVVEVVSSKEDF